MRSYLFPAIASVLLLLFGGSPAVAQNNKPIRSGTWYEDQAGSAFSTSGFLTVKFALTPADKFINITNVGCNINSSEPVDSATLRIGTTSGGDQTGRFASVSIGNVTSVPGRFYYTFNSPLFLKIGPSRYPTLELSQYILSQPADISATCTIVGTLSND